MQQPLQPPQQPPAYPPLSPSPSHSSKSRLSYVDPWDPAPAPAPVPANIPVEAPFEYISDNEYRSKVEFGISNRCTSNKGDLYTSQVNLVMRKVESSLNYG